MSHVSFSHNFGQVCLYIIKKSKSGIILAKLNDTMQRKQYSNKATTNTTNKTNKQTRIQKGARITLDYFLWWKNVLKSSNLEFLSIRYVWTVLNIYLLPEFHFFGFKCKKVNVVASLLNKMQDDPQFSCVFYALICT